MDLQRQKYIIEELEPLSKVLLEQLSQKDKIQPDEFLRGRKNDKETVLLVIDKLIQHNVIRYTIEGSIVWHGRPQKCTFGTL